MADEAGQAAGREELERAQWEKKMREIAAMHKNRNKDCIECGEEIPLARQQATGGTELCFPCAEIAEIKRRRYR